MWYVFNFETFNKPECLYRPLSTSGFVLTRSVSRVEGFEAIISKHYVTVRLMGAALFVLYLYV